MINLEFEAYSEGRASYHNGVTDNPYDVNTQYTLWEAWFDGFGDEQRRQSESQVEKMRMRSSYFNYDL